MENSIKKSEERFRELFENNRTAILLIDPQTWKILDGNTAATDFYGYPIEKLQTLHLSDINPIHPEITKAEIKKIKSKKGSRYITLHRLANGNIRNVEIYSGLIQNGKQELIYTSIYDITEQIVARKRLEIFNKAIEQSSSCIIITDKEGTIEFINPAFTRISGYSARDVIGQNPRILKSGLIEKQTYEKLWNEILSGESWSGEFINKRKNGEIYWEKATISPIFDQKGDITHFVAIKDDITQQKQLIRDLMIAKDKAEESSKLKSAFLSNMSHEIRTPLNSIIGFAELLIDENNSKDQQEEFKKYIIESSDQLLGVVNDVLDMSLITTQQISIFNERFDINTFITEVSTRYNKSIQLKGLKFNIEKPVESGLCQIYSDFSRLKQIIEKLFNNALKYTHEGAITFGYCFKEGKIRLFVTDTGIGISKDKQYHIYESFTQASNELTRKYGGLGLGLTIAKRICELIGAEISFESIQGQGSTFHITLPASCYQLLSIPATTEKDLDYMDMPVESLKIMIVEDDMSSFEYLKTILVRFGLEIIHVKNGDEVLSAYKQNRDTQLVIMDIRIPKLDGWQATQLLKGFNPQLPVIVLTAFTHEGDMQRAQVAGADLFLTKPTRPEVLMKHIINLTKEGLVNQE